MINMCETCRRRKYIGERWEVPVTECAGWCDIPISIIEQEGLKLDEVICLNRKQRSGCAVYVPKSV